MVDTTCDTDCDSQDVAIFAVKHVYALDHGGSI